MEADSDIDGLRGKVLLATGSGRGIGAQLVRTAARGGARIVINCRNNQHGAEALGQELRRSGAEAVVVRANVADPPQARCVVEEALRAFGQVDVVVNTVGEFLWKPVAEMDPTEWRAVMASNLDSVYHMCHAVLPHMREQRWGRIVNLGAVGAERTLGQPQVSAYSAAKAGVIAFSKALALEEARNGITVNVVSPGAWTDSEDAARRGEGAPSPLGDRVPVGRSGAPEDVVRAILFFASPQADFVTGQVLAVAGGWRL